MMITPESAARYYSTWTVDKVREQLPNVKVQTADGRIYEGAISGRRNHFATVTIVTPLGWLRFEYAWQTLANALNSKHALKV